MNERETAAMLKKQKQIDLHELPLDEKQVEQADAPEVLDSMYLTLLDVCDKDPEIARKMVVEMHSKLGELLLVHSQNEFMTIHEGSINVPSEYVDTIGESIKTIVELETINGIKFTRITMASSNGSLAERVFYSGECHEDIVYPIRTFRAQANSLLQGLVNDDGVLFVREPRASVPGVAIIKYGGFLHKKLGLQGSETRFSISEMRSRFAKLLSEAPHTDGITVTCGSSNNAFVLLLPYAEPSFSPYSNFKSISKELQGGVESRLMEIKNYRPPCLSDTQDLKEESFQPVQGIEEEAFDDKKKYYIDSIKSRFPSYTDFMSVVGVKDRSALKFGNERKGLMYIANSVLGLGLESVVGVKRNYEALARVIYQDDSSSETKKSSGERKEHSNQMSKRDYYRMLIKEEFPTMNSFVGLKPDERKALRFGGRKRNLYYLATKVFGTGYKFFYTGDSYLRLGQAIYQPM